MNVLRMSVLGAMAVGFSISSSAPAEASVSISVGFDALVKDADAVAVVTPQESKSVWEDGRIYTYTRVTVDKGVAGDTGSGETWVRTMGGVVEHIGQLVDGEAVFAAGKPNLLFLHKFKTSGTWEVSARAQGQYPVVADVANVKLLKVVRSSSAGTLLPPKQWTVEAQGVSTQTVQTQLATVRLATDVMHDRSLDAVSKEVATAWKTAHVVTK